MLLVTGITGHAGGYFLDELIQNQYPGKIRCVVRENSNTAKIDNANLDIEKVTGDLDDPTFIQSIMPGVETIMHIYNIHHSVSILKAAVQHHVKRVILVHTTGIYSEFKYASEGYKNIEAEIKKMISSPTFEPVVTILRPSMIYGDIKDRNMSKFIKMIDRFKIMPVIDGGKSLIQPVNARDLGKAFYSTLTIGQGSKFEAYDLTGDRPIEMIEAFRLISRELNTKNRFVSVPLSFGVVAAKAVKVLSLKRIDYVERVQRMGENRSYSHDAAKRALNYSPMRFEEGIKVEVREYLTATDRERGK